MSQLYPEILAASKRLSGIAHKTPVLTSNYLNKQLGAEIFFKCENFQKVGAFKFRGAYNSIAKLSAQQKAIGVLAYSSGNHAQAIACVGKLLGVETTIVMPDDAPTIKLAATRGYGATVLLYDPKTQVREQVAADLLARRPLTLIPPFDHQDVIAGQGTVGLEFHQQVTDLDSILVPCGGGGLLSGCAIATKQHHQKCRVIGIEPELANDATLSFNSGKLQSIPTPATIADGTRTTSLGDKTFPIILEHVDEMQTVSEEAIKSAVRFLFYTLKIVVEPSGALGLAALLEGSVKAKGRVGVVISGGNIDGETMISILAE